MSSNFKPIKLYGKGGPNPPKVAIILAELEVPYEVVEVPFPDVKKPYYTALNPNGRLPTIEDPNTGLTLWESGAIVEYLVEHYDKSNNISFPPGSNEAALAKQWSYFQASGQGAYYGQAAWFTKFHHESLPSAKERYNKEVDRVSNVLEEYLGKQDSSGDGPWLIAGRCSYADLVFLQWQRVIGMILPKEEYDLEKYPHVKAWVEQMMERDGVKKGLATQAQEGH